LEHFFITLDLVFSFCHRIIQLCGFYLHVDVVLVHWLIGECFPNESPVLLYDILKRRKAPKLSGKRQVKEPYIKRTNSTLSISDLVQVGLMRNNERMLKKNKVLRPKFLIVVPRG
jgi:hypothetical protein